MAVDHTRQRPDGYAQVVAGVAPTLRPANRQYAQIAADLDYTPPSFNAFDRLTDTDTPLAVEPGSRRRVGQRRLEARTRPAHVDDRLALLELGSVERSRLHRPAGDDDLGGAVEAAAVDAGSPLRRRRVARTSTSSPASSRSSQALDSNPSFKQEQGSAAARFLLAPSAAAATPGLLDGYGFNQFLDVPQHERRGLRPGRVARHRSPAPAARPALQLRPEERGLRSAGLRRAADDRPGADRAASARSSRRRRTPRTSTTRTRPASSRRPTRSRTRSTPTRPTATSFKSVGLNLNGLPTDALGTTRSCRRPP